MNGTLPRDDYQALAATFIRALTPFVETVSGLADSVGRVFAAAQRDPQFREALAKIEEGNRKDKQQI